MWACLLKYLKRPPYMASCHSRKALTTISCYKSTKASKSPCSCKENMYIFTFWTIQWCPLWTPGVKLARVTPHFIIITLPIVTFHSYISRRQPWLKRDLHPLRQRTPVVAMMSMLWGRCVFPWTNQALITRRWKVTSITLDNANNPTRKRKWNCWTPTTLRQDMRVHVLEDFNPPSLTKFDGRSDAYKYVPFQYADDHYRSTRLLEMQVVVWHFQGYHP